MRRPSGSAGCKIRHLHRSIVIKLSSKPRECCDPGASSKMPGDAGERGEPARGISQSKNSKYYWRALTLLACASPISFAHCTSTSSTWNSLVCKVGWHSVFLRRLALHTSNMRSDACLMLSRIAIAAELVGTERAREELGGPHRVTFRLFPLGIAEPPGVGYSRRGEPPDANQPFIEAFYTLSSSKCHSLTLGGKMAITRVSPER